MRTHYWKLGICRRNSNTPMHRLKTTQCVICTMSPMAGSWESQTEEYTNPGTGPNQRNILIKRANTDAESKIKPSPDLYTLFRRGRRYQGERI